MTGGATCCQFGDKSPPNLKRTPQGRSEGSPKGSRKVERGEAERTLKSGIEERERAPRGERDWRGQEEPVWDCPTRSRHGASGPSLTWPRGAREASAERLLGVASRLGPGARAGYSGPI